MAVVASDPAVATPTSAFAGDDAGVRLGRRSIFILPTSAGVAFGLVLVVMFLGALNYGNGLGYGLTFLLASLGLVSMLHTYRELRGLVLVASAGPAVHAGAEATFALHLHVPEGRARRGLTIRYRVRDDEVSDERLLEVPLLDQRSMRVSLVAASRRRGWLALDRVSISTRFPLGLFRAWAVPALGARVLVYPRPGGTRPLPETTLDNGRDGRATGRGEEDFSGLRDYVPGDSPQRIHWKAAARGLGLPVKLFSGASAADLELALDATQGDLEARLGQLCRWVLEADARGLRYALVLPGAPGRIGTGAGHRRRCLERLALYAPGGAS